LKAGKGEGRNHILGTKRKELYFLGGKKASPGNAKRARFTRREKKEKKCSSGPKGRRKEKSDIFFQTVNQNGDAPPFTDKLQKKGKKELLFVNVEKGGGSPILLPPQKGTDACKHPAAKNVEAVKGRGTVFPRLEKKKKGKCVL